MLVRQGGGAEIVHPSQEQIPLLGRRKLVPAGKEDLVRPQTGRQILTDQGIKFSAVQAGGYGVLLRQSLHGGLYLRIRAHGPALDDRDASLFGAVPDAGGQVEVTVCVRPGQQVVGGLRHVVPPWIGPVRRGEGEDLQEAEALWAFQGLRPLRVKSSSHTRVW